MTMQTHEWLEAAKDNFNAALADRNVALAKDVISDTFDAGYLEEARAMSVELRSFTTEQPL